LLCLIAVPPLALLRERALLHLLRLEHEKRHRGVIQMLAVAPPVIGPLSRAPAIQVSVEAPTSADACTCLRRYFEELSERFDGGFDPDKSNPARDEEMTPPAGFFVMARLDGRPAGCGVLKIGDGAIGEIKRMWTAPSARGKGVARALLRELEATAREAGLALLRLETNRALKEAQALYRKEGYIEVAPFNDEHYAHHWFEKRL
jgi:GNAT superfamily N-acetyltransferase